MSSGEIRGYHAHVYFDARTAEKARALRSRVSTSFDVDVGRFHERNVGPHRRWSYQIAFAPELFGELVPWLARHREDMTVLVHGLTGDDLYDHTQLAMWLGPSVELDLDALSR